MISGEIIGRLLLLRDNQMKTSASQLRAVSCG